MLKMILMKKKVLAEELTLIKTTFSTSFFPILINLKKRKSRKTLKELCLMKDQFLNLLLYTQMLTMKLETKL